MNKRLLIVRIYLRIKSLQRKLLTSAFLTIYRSKSSRQKNLSRRFSLHLKTVSGGHLEGNPLNPWSKMHVFKIGGIDA